MLFTVVGTLFMLWPTVVGTKITRVTHSAARWCLRALAAGLLVTVIGMLTGSRVLATAPDSST